MTAQYPGDQPGSALPGMFWNTSPAQSGFNENHMTSFVYVEEPFQAPSRVLNK